MTGAATAVAVLSLLFAAYASGRAARTAAKCAELNQLVHDMLRAGVSDEAASIAAFYAADRIADRAGRR